MSGDELQAFIKEQQSEERAARLQDREEREKARQLELAKLDLENKRREERDRARELELAKLDLENKKFVQQAREKEMEFELRKMQLQESGDSDTSAAKSLSVGLGISTAPLSKTRVKMPYFDENKDCMDSYLNRFERFAQVEGWQKESYAIYLSALLSGKALDVYSRLPVDQASDYDSLKSALLKRYQLSEDGFKRKFRTARADTGESPTQFITRLASYLQRWVELAGAAQTYEGLSALVVREQYLSVCSPDMAMFLKERITANLDELGKLAEQYVEAHVDNPTAKRQHDLRKVKEDTATRKCYRCGSSEHLLKDCPAEGKKTSPRPTLDRSCFVCGKKGHLARNCFHRLKTAALEADTTSDEGGCSECLRRRASNSNTCNALMAPEVQLKCGCKLPVIADGCQNNSALHMPVKSGLFSGKEVSVLRDTGCSTIVVRESLVPPEMLTGEKKMCVLIDGTVRRNPVAQIEIDTPYFTGSVKAVCMKNPLYDIIVGNVDGAKAVCESTDAKEEGQAVTTRQQAKMKPTKPLPVANDVDIDVSSTDLATMQADDNSLKKAWEKASEDSSSTVTSESSFFVQKGLLYRRKSSRHGQTTKQLVLPVMLRNRVMKLSHESLMGGHQGVTRTLDRINAHFWWPGMTEEVQRYCRSCDICQRTVSKGRTARLPLGNVPLIDTPFKRVAVDLIGPVYPATDRGKRYILTLVDYATRYPEAVALSNINTETVAEALVSMFSRVGVPAEILSDQGTQFLSHVMKEVCRLLSVKQLVTTPYHPQCNGLVERFNGTLKLMLKRMCSERPKDWDRYVDPMLFAYREVPQESLGFSPFEMIYGHSVRGPMTILKQLWTSEQEDPDVKSTYQYVIDLRERLQDTCDLAHQNLLKSQVRQKKYYDCRSRERSFKPGEKVLLLLPTDENKLLMQWKGPFIVLECVNQCDYKIQLPGKVRLFHANLLKKYCDRTEETPEELGAAVLEAQEDDNVVPVELLADGKETYNNVKISDRLDEEQTRQVRQLVYEYRDIFTDIPKVTNLGEHSITLTSSEPIRGKAYPLPHAMKEILDKELDTMLNMGIIEPSTASYASPIVMVKKPDGSTRVCVDYRNLNKVTVFDPEPIPSAEEIFAKLSGDKYFSKFDLTKGYWEVPMKAEDKDVTTFICHRGLYRFNVMPFGLVNAPATFSRLMRKLLRDSVGLDNYLDDVLAHSSEWSDHLKSLRDFFERVRKANLTLRPTKCEIGESDISFLGHQLSEDRIQPRHETVNRVLQAPRPENKKQLQSFLGLVGFYRHFIPNFAAIASPLTDATRKGAPNQLVWEELQDKAFQELKARVVNPPILHMANFDKTFILQTDSADTGVGSALMQEDKDGMKHPIAFASRKLLPRESRYSTIEKECLAIVWAITKFQDYLYGKEFVLETDHQPLQYLGNARFQNGRLMRWALALQPYRFVVRAIHGRENVVADFLSRYPCESE